MSLFEDASLIVTPNAVKAGKLYAIKPDSGAGDLTVTRATEATRVNSAGLIQVVANNVPRLDYTNGSCPSILVEPQRTNLLLRSEEISTVPWTLTRSTVNINSITSPSGTLTADELVSNVTGTNGSWTRQVVSPINGAFSISIYAKQSTSPFLQVNLDGLGAVIFDLSNGTIKASSVVIGQINSIGSDGWYRCTISGTATSQTTILFIVGNSSMTLATWFSTLGDSVYIWGAQLEVGSNATSYIPTVASTVTRNADVISKTGISDLIGQTEGTMFVEVNLKNIDAVYRIFGISDNTTANRIYMSIIPNNLEVTCFSGGNLQFSNTSSVTLGRYKIALSYKLNDFKLYVNGNLVVTDTLASVPLCPNIYIGQRENSSGTFIFNNYINSTALWKIALTDQECINLTTI